MDMADTGGVEGLCPAFLCSLGAAGQLSSHGAGLVEGRWW